jgi:hypothetical protein
LVGLIFKLLGILVFIKGVQTTRRKGLGEGFVEIIGGIAFVVIGLLIWLGYIS